jgi:hypothetical protein
MVHQDCRPDGDQCATSRVSFWFGRRGQLDQVVRHSAHADLVLDQEAHQLLPVHQGDGNGVHTLGLGGHQS